MKIILKDLYLGFKRSAFNTKILIMLLMIIYIGLILLASIKVNYEVMTPGSINEAVSTDLDTKEYSAIQIKTNNSSGNINTVGVYSHIRVSVFQYLISGFSDDLKISDYNPKTDLTKSEEYERGVIHKDFSIQNALIAAYNYAELDDPTIKLDYKFEGLIVSTVGKLSKSNLKVGDIIQKINESSFNNYTEFISLLDKIDTDSPFTFTVKRGKEIEVLNSSLYKDESNSNTYKLGIEITESYQINPNEPTNPSFIISDKIRSIGSSGGAMMALSIYNALNKDDLTKGKKIIGTGTISVDGKVGAIGGIEQKIITAHISKADIFFVPSVHFDVALEKYKEINATFKLISVNSLEDMISYLKENS